MTISIQTGTPGPVQSNDRAQLAEAAKNFEAIFLRQMLSAARESSIRSDLFGSDSSDTFRQMRDEAFADIASEQGVLGLGAMIEAQMSRNIKD